MEHSMGDLDVGDRITLGCTVDSVVIEKDGDAGIDEKCGIDLCHDDHCPAFYDRRYQEKSLKFLKSPPVYPPSFVF